MTAFLLPQAGTALHQEGPSGPVVSPVEGQGRSQGRHPAALALQEFLRKPTQVSPQKDHWEIWQCETTGDQRKTEKRAELTATSAQISQDHILLYCCS